MTEQITDGFSDFDQAKHFRGKVDWKQVKDMTGADFLWEILEPISDMIKDARHEETRAKRLSPYQKALHFFWYLDGQVTNGGFIQFYCNGYDSYLPAIKKGLALMEHQQLLEQVIKSEQAYEKHKADFDKWKKKKDWEWLYDNLEEFEEMDDWYYANKEEHYTLAEKFVRLHIDDFIIKNG